jgi:hypothetical protein
MPAQHNCRAEPGHYAIRDSYRVVARHVTSTRDKQRWSMNKRTLGLSIGFVLLSSWAIVHLHDGYQLVLFCCAMGLLVYLLDKFVKA